MRACLLICAVLQLWAAPPEQFTLRLRSRTEKPAGSGNWVAAEAPRQFSTRETAILLCDMWDNHWCKGATERVVPIAKSAGPLLERARERGILIIHAPSDVTDFYTNAPARLAMLKVPLVEPPPNRVLPDPALPIDDKDGGCDTGDSFYQAWKRQHPLIRIDGRDLISDKGREVYSALKLRGIRNLLLMGVHTNMCVLNRTFAIKQMTRWGVPCVLIRDLTDTMYNPKARPYVSHDEGTRLVVEHIEKYWAPTVVSSQILKALQ
jgi:nicotinamidase-related amidase